MKVCFATIVVVSNVLLAHGALEWNTTALTKDQEENIVDVLKITPDEDEMKAKPVPYIQNLLRVVGDGIEEVAKGLITKKGTVPTTQSGAQGSSTSNPTVAPTQTAEEKAASQEKPAAPDNNRRKRAADKVDEGSTAASTKEDLPALTTVLVISSKPEDFDFSEPIKFFVKTEHEIIDGEKLKDKATDIKSAIEEKAKALELKLTVSVVGQGLAAWAIVLIVIAVLLVVGAAGYFVVTYFRKQRGNSF